ncbi:collagen alpha-2(I) chain-like [Palaemon carinicauda]|uniref:collagen alpha-2(I) chain-like n=1 Tax=Palaemon carinicauda TaxID=392227 RepID=UPI0035B5F8FA
MAGFRCGSLDSGLPEGRLQASLPDGTSPTHPSSEGRVVNSQRPLETGGAAGTGVIHDRQGSIGISGEPRPGVLQQALPCGESNRRVEAGHRPLSPQQVCRKDGLQDGHAEDSTGGLEGGRFPNVPRPQGRLLSNPRAPLQQEVPQDKVGVPSPSVQNPLLRSVDGSSGVHEGIHDGLGMGARAGYPTDQIPGQLVASFSLIGRTEGERREVARALQGIGDHDQLGEIPVESQHQDDLLGDGPGHPVSESLPLSGGVRESGTNSATLPDGPAQDGQGLAETDRAPGIVGEVSTAGEAQTPGGSMEPEGGVDPGKGTPHSSASLPGNKGRPAMVERQVEYRERNALRTRPSGDAVVHGHIEGRVGSAPAGKIDKRQMVQRGGGTTHKHSGDGGRVESMSGIRLSPPRKHHGVDVRQRHGSGLRKEARGPKIKRAMRPSDGTVGMGGKGRDRNDSKIHPRKEKRAGRRPQQGGSSDRLRMDPTPGGSSGSHPEVGLPSDRHVRHTSERPASRVLFSSPRAVSSVQGCLPTSLGQPRCLCLPSLRVDQTSAKQSEVGDQHDDDFGSALVAGERVVRRPKRISSPSSLAAPRQARSAPSTSLLQVARKPSIPPPYAWRLSRSS